MTHDPMCPRTSDRGAYRECYCDLIARVVEREKRLAGERVAALPYEAIDLDGETDEWVTRTDAADAACDGAA